MSPAGFWPQLQAAVEAGADAVYFGLHHFSARAKVGFSLADLPEVLRTLHRRGVRGYVTFNTLVFDHEIPEAARVLARIAAAGADAIIVQDLGALALAQDVAPDLPLHASTQMSVTDSRGASLAAAMGVCRVTLARELSLAGIRAIRASTQVELEVFVHGALCVAYSGQCFSSEAWGGRSANRGQCAQACRLPYELLVDGVRKPLGDARYLLSPEDLYALHQVPELLEIGIESFKIEGRYKDADYVAAATSAYRRAVDEACAGLPLSFTPREELDLAQVYSRGLGPHFLTGVNHQKVVSGRAPRHRGPLLGHVTRVTSASVFVHPTEAHRVSPLKPGDGLVFDAAAWRSPEEKEEGGRLFELDGAPSDELELRFANLAIDFSRVRPGDLLWRSDDPAVSKGLRAFTAAASPLRKQPVAVAMHASSGAPLLTRWRLTERPEIQVEVSTHDPLVPAQHPTDPRDIAWKQFARLGPTPFQLVHLDVHASGLPFLPASVLNHLRREAVDQLLRLLEQPPHPCTRPFSFRLPPPDAAQPSQPFLHLLVRSPGQIQAALDQRPASLTLDFLDLYGLKPCADRVVASGTPLRVATPRILKPGEEKLAEFLFRLDCPLLVRPLGLLSALPPGFSHALTGDFSLNAANALSARRLLAMGLTRLTPTHDLNGDQVANLARSLGGHLLEAVAWQHLPIFHTEHCVFCRFLSTGTTHLDCGRPCESHRVELRDPLGRAHPVLADAGCRNTVFNAEAQSAALHLPAWLDAGVRHFRLEFAHESPAQIGAITEGFRLALAGQLSPARLPERLARFAPQGVTEGSLFIPANYQELPILQ